MNKILRNRRNIAEKIRGYTYKTKRILASNNPRELDFTFDNSYGNALYTFNLINDHNNLTKNMKTYIRRQQHKKKKKKKLKKKNYTPRHKTKRKPQKYVKNRGKLKGYTNKIICLSVVNIHILLKFHQIIFTTTSLCHMARFTILIG